MENERRSKTQQGIPISSIKRVIGELPRLELNSDLRASAFVAARQRGCFVSSRNATKPDQLRTLTLGPLTRWLIALDLLTEDEQDMARLIHQALGLSDGRGQGRSAVKRLYGLRLQDDILAVPARYCASDPTAENKTDRHTAKVNLAVIRLLNKRYSKLRGSELRVAEFLSIPVPLDQKAKEFGEQPLDWFAKWLKFGAVGTNTSTHDSGAEPRLAHLTKKWHGEMVDKLVYVQQRPSPNLKSSGSFNERIVNVHSDGPPHDLSGFCAAALRSLRQYGAADDPVQVVHIHLQLGQTRTSVVQRLCEAFSIDPTFLKPVLDGSRPLDLSVDLDPVRHALTVTPAVILFDGWQAAPGPYTALFELFCNSHWGELMRVLAQPHVPTILAANDPKSRLDTYKILLLTRGKATNLDLWCSHVPLSELWIAPPARDETTTILYEQYQLTNAELELLAHRRPENLDASLGSDLQEATASDRRASVMACWLECSKLSLLETATLCFVAASINGLRRNTLLRCIKEWIRIFAPTVPGVTQPRDSAQSGHSLAAALDKAVYSVQRKFEGIVIEALDEETTHLSEGQRQMELDRIPSFSKGPDEELQSAKVTTFSSQALRALFVAEWTGQPGFGPLSMLRSSNSIAQAFPTCSWPNINFILAEEAIRQGTSQLRHQGGAAYHGPYSMRRLMQGIVHGLASLESRPGQSSESVYPPGALPVEVDRRFHYLYTFLYRQVVEGGEWRLARSDGRPDLKLELLSLFIGPETAPMILTGWNDEVPRSRLPGLADRADQPKRRWESDKFLYADLLLTMGRAGLDFGGAKGSEAVRSALERLPRDDAPPIVNSLLPAQESGFGELQRSAVKLRIDWLNSIGTKDALDDAAKLGWQALTRFGIAQKLETTLVGSIRSAVDLSYEGKSGGLKMTLAAIAEMQADIREQTPNVATREFAADVLFRLSETRSIEADKYSHRLRQVDSNEVTPAQSIRQFASAMALYWVADRTRASAATVGGRELRWPRASARSMRYYVRVTLKLAGLIAKEALGKSHRMMGLVVRLMVQAQARIGVYTRHNFRYVREQDSILLLEAARLRTWVRVQLLLDADRLNVRATSSSVTASAYKQHLASLDYCWQLLEKAEGQLFLLGFQDLQMRRLLLERVKLVIAVTYAGSAFRELEFGYNKLHAIEWSHKVEAGRVLARASLDVLRKAAVDDEVWRGIVRMQEISADEAFKRWDGAATRATP